MAHKYNTYPLPCGCAVEFIEGGWFELPKARWVISCNLHAAAPLLLEACKGLLASIESMIVDDNVQIYSGDKVRIAKAQAAIAAASPDSYQAEPEVE